MSCQAWPLHNTRGDKLALPSNNLDEEEAGEDINNK